jgi:hypothetical protein
VNLIERCPACGTVWDEGAQEAQLAFDRLCKALRQTKATIEFHVRSEERSVGGEEASGGT